MCNFSSHPNTEQRKAMLFISRINAVHKQINTIFARETATFLSSKNMSNILKNLKIMAVVKNISSLKNLEVKRKL